MGSTRPGRNDPCPCGSGKRYKHCCLGRTGSAASDMRQDLEAALAGQQFGSLEEAQAFMDQFGERRNAAPLDDFCGLSPDQMHCLIRAPLESPHVVRFPDVVAEAPAGPAMTLFNLLVDAIGEQGLKATAKGNLPRVFCAQAVEALREEDPGGLTSVHVGRPNREDDFPELTAARVVAQLAGLVRKYRGRFLLTRRCRSLLDQVGAAGVYPLLLRAHATRFNWGWADRYPDLPFIQHSFAFVPYLLSRYGAVERPASFYEDAWLRAFPMIVREVEPRPYSSAEDQVRHCFTLRALERFAWFMGLVTMVPAGSGAFSSDYRLRKTPLLDAAVVFTADPAAGSGSPVGRA